PDRGRAQNFLGCASIGRADGRAVGGCLQDGALIDRHARGAGIERPRILAVGQLLLTRLVEGAALDTLADTVEVGGGNGDVDVFLDHRGADAGRVRHVVDLVEVDVEIDVRAAGALAGEIKTPARSLGL